MAHFQGRAVSFGDGNFHRVYHTGAKDSVKKGVSCDARVHSASKNKRSSKMTQGPVVVGLSDRSSKGVSDQLANRNQHNQTTTKFKIPKMMGLAKCTSFQI